MVARILLAHHHYASSPDGKVGDTTDDDSDSSMKMNRSNGSNGQTKMIDLKKKLKGMTMHV